LEIGQSVNMQGNNYGLQVKQTKSI
jgi:hypothetical protein